MGKIFKAVGTSVGVSFAVAFFIFLVVIGPLAFIWSANTLFNLKIAYTGWNWLVAVVFLGCVRGS